MDWKDTLASLNLPEDPDPELENSPIGSSVGEKKKGKIQIVTEKKGRAGKTATIICGFDPSVTDEEIDNLAAKIKKRLSTGGSSRGGEILIQGDRKTDVAKILREEGYKVNA